MRIVPAALHPDGPPEWRRGADRSSTASLFFKLAMFRNVGIGQKRSGEDL